YLALLTLDDVRQLLAGRTALLRDNRHRSVRAAVGERLPAPHLYALAYFIGYQSGHRARAVEVFNDDPRIKDSRPVVRDEHRYLAQRIVSGHLGRGVVRRGQHELVGDSGFRQAPPPPAREPARRRPRD